jgi:hypothetical protein
MSGENTNLLNLEQASEEIEKWLDSKKILQQRRKDLEAQIELLTSAIMNLSKSFLFLLVKMLLFLS